MTTQPIVPPVFQGQQVPRCPYCDKQMPIVNFYSWQTKMAVALAMFCTSCGKLLGQEIMMIAEAPPAQEEDPSPTPPRIHRVS